MAKAILEERLQQRTVDQIDVQTVLQERISDRVDEQTINVSVSEAKVPAVQVVQNADNQEGVLVQVLKGKRAMAKDNGFFGKFHPQLEPNACSSRRNSGTQC